uniref:ULP_PROTEASE domain-containing protein n=1 Tax=Heterorhabditis bacteriophora TaxID=37862 RepID=A0A1I7WQB9_HETBA
MSSWCENHVDCDAMPMVKYQRSVFSSPSTHSFQTLQLEVESLVVGSTLFFPERSFIFSQYQLAFHGTVINDDGHRAINSAIVVIPTKDVFHIWYARLATEEHILLISLTSKCKTQLTNYLSVHFSSFELRKDIFESGCTSSENNFEELTILSSDDDDNDVGNVLASDDGLSDLLDPIKSTCRVMIIDSKMHDKLNEIILPRIHAEIFNIIKGWLRMMILAKHDSHTAFITRYSQHRCQSLPDQLNQSDCGLFMLRFAERFVIEDRSWMDLPHTVLEEITVGESDEDFIAKVNGMKDHIRHLIQNMTEMDLNI